MKWLIMRCFQLLPGPAGRFIRQFSRVMNGVVRVSDGDTLKLLEQRQISFTEVGVTTFVQESYKWPKSVIKSELGPANRYTDKGFSLACIDGAIVAGDGRVFDSRYRLIAESLATHDYQAINPGRWANTVSREITGRVLALNWWSGNSNLYHWLRDVFSRSFALTALPDEPITIIAPNRPRPFQQHGLDALVRLFPRCQIVEVAFDEKVRVEQLLQPCVNPYVRGNGYLSLEVADFIRDVYLNELVPAEHTKIAYLSRQTVGSRRLLDEKEVLDRVSQEIPLRVLAIEQLPFPEQLRLMANTSALAGVYGAGLVHILFTLRKGLVEIHNGDSRETHFSTLSVGCGVPYRQVQGGSADRLQDFRLGKGGTEAFLAALVSMSDN
jgi:hypothetical protein